jgi:hypothetical protein
MINLIPPAARKSVIREYWLRVAAIWMFLIGTGLLLVSVLLLPTYMQILIQMGGITKTTDDTTARVASYDGLVAELALANTRAGVLTSNSTAEPLSVYIENIEAVSGSAVTINSYAYEMLATGEAKITLAGIAARRGDLASFRDTLSTDPQYRTVELPISNLIKERDLLFSIELTLASSTPTP